MFSKTLTDGSHVRRFSIETAGEDGWEVRQLEDSDLITQKRCTDWHRVEYILARFSREIEGLKRQGWREADA
jgi:hypothetical protein